MTPRFSKTLPPFGRCFYALVAVLTLVGAPGALGQEQGQSNETGGGTSFFQAFFLSEDYLGLAVIWLLIVASFVSLSLSLLFTMRYRRAAIMPPETRDDLESLLAEKKYKDAIAYAAEDESFLGKMASAALSEASNGYGAMERALEEKGDAETTKILRPIEILNVMGNIAPMMGLFGTVYGMIVAFQSLVDAGGSPDPVDLAAGISTALVTTFWGLIVAIPALAAYALVRNKIDALTTESMLVAEEIIKPFKPSGKRKRSSSSSSSKPTPNPEG